MHAGSRPSDAPLKPPRQRAVSFLVLQETPGTLLRPERTANIIRTVRTLNERGTLRSSEANATAKQLKGAELDTWSISISDYPMIFFTMKLNEGKK
jgi:hypothetical protein